MLFTVAKTPFYLVSLPLFLLKPTVLCIRLSCGLPLGLKDARTSSCSISSRFSWVPYFTYIDDIVEGIIRVIDNPPAGNKSWNGENPDAGSSRAPSKIYNIGNNNPVRLMDFIKAIEEALHKKAKMNMLPLQPGDVPSSHADVTDLVTDMGYKPNTPIKEGVKKFIEWYLEFYEK